ncbi:hypothetical protein BV394_06955 [Brevirhabdus pacifica]|uniref:Uncharacterized protein n=1 Tax=Brevirhabdus pacifica TaxID=1267768 RepID=A0A1U7DHK9_9RHOB|nr:DUF1127 domain-containing protein [Brevirhabdus pacifica]APX89487.1 hypothetical protein BV394_06955 [Brevirhabdus pacifica]OWU76506.1 hypothetical protein ATO5_09345 [Loktanella sp. 22II-4b]PJJ85864.1 uncharacterized protein DUF1127 [Brevirhabdus pacifica]
MDATLYGRSQAPLVTDLINRIAPRKFRRDPLGLVSGYRAYLVYSHLSSLSDWELAELGLRRADLPRIAGDVIFQARNEAR